MSTNFASINGTPVPIRKGQHVEWTLLAGFVAPIQAWEVPADFAASLLSSAGVGTDREYELKFGDPDDPIKVERAYLVGSAPADNPQRAYLLFADARIYLGFEVFVIDVNVRRRLGDVRLVGAGLVASTLADSVAYEPWSISGNNAYTWDTFKNRALAYLAAPRHGRPALAYVVDSLSVNIAAQIVPETITDSDGTSGLARAIESMPCASTYVDLAGVLHVFDAMPGAEIPLVGQLPPSLWHHGDLRLVDLSGIRPSLWRVYVDYALEVRFNYPAVFTGDKNSHLGDLVNVLQVTDQVLSIPAGGWGPARIVGQGTWISLPEAFAAWGAKTIGPFALPALTEDIVADHWFGDALQRYVIGGGLTTEDPIWAARIAQLMKCYRTYFRVNTEMWNRVRHWWATRVAVWDPTTGTLAPSPVYCNFHYMQLDNFVADNINVYGVNVQNSYPNGTGKLKDGSPSGFEVDVVDDELMIFRVIRNIARYPDHTRLAPAPTQDGVTVTGGAGLNEAVLQKLQHIPTTQSDALECQPTEWCMSTILTCSPAAPNDLRRLYEVQVPIGDAINALGGLTTTPVCKGPDQELRSHLTDARVAWPPDDDPDARTAVLSTFGRDDPGDINFVDPVRSLVPVNTKTELLPLAQAMAAADLVAKLDHYEGKKAVPISGGIAPIGSIHKVTHKVSQDRAVTIVEADGAPARVNWLDFLPASARSYILKEIQKGRSA